MNPTTPCPHCQMPIAFSQFVMNTGLTVTCKACQAKLHLKPYIWLLTLILVIALFAMFPMIGMQNLLENDHGERAIMRVGFIVLIAISVGMSYVAFQRGPFLMPKA